MSLGDELRGQIDGILFDLAKTVNLMAELDKQFDEVRGGILLLGITDSHPGITGSVAISNAAKDAADMYLRYLFDLRERLTMYRRGLDLR